MQVSTTCLLLLVSSCYLDKTVAHTIQNYEIYGGKTVKITEVPFMAIYSPKPTGFGCGASIVHEQFLVSAAHCAVAGYKYVTVGKDFMPGDGGILCDVEQMFVHPKYDTITHDYDVVVIKLKNRLTFSDRVNSIEMVDPSSLIPTLPTPGDMMFVIGFGKTEHENNSNNLLKVDVPYVDHDKCREKMAEFQYTFTDRMICAGGEENKGSCNGDSGGPLVYNGKLVGIVSFGTPQCAMKDVPGVYADVASLRDFIDNIITKNM